MWGGRERERRKKCVYRRREGGRGEEGEVWVGGERIQFVYIHAPLERKEAEQERERERLQLSR